MALDEYYYDDMHLNFRYGMFNSNYPNPIKEMEFALDFDCYCDEALNGISNIIEHINTGHEKIQNLFEESITDALRGVMNNG